MPIPNLDMVLLFVKDPLVSKDFYHTILGLEPVEEHPTFVMFALPNGILLGLWSPKTAEPPALASAGSSEIAFSEEDVDGVHARLVKLNIPFSQIPTDMDFGRTCVAVDPDGHRIRFYRIHEK